MPDLMQDLIDTEHRHHAAALTAIEAARGAIEEAETLAATLRHHGIANAGDAGYASRPILLGDPVTVQAWVDAGWATGGPDAATLAQALLDADLRPAFCNLDRGNSYGQIHLAGIDAHITAGRGTVIGLVAQMTLLARAKEAA